MSPKPFSTIRPLLLAALGFTLALGAGCPRPGSTSSSSSSTGGGSGSSSGGSSGNIGTPCTASDTCGSDNGTALSCVDGRCELPGCISGSVGCPCRDGTCSDATLSCTSGACTVTGCVPGATGCLCGPNNMCETGLTCTGRACMPLGTLGISVQNPNVRACDLLLRTGTRSLVGVTFAASVTGELMRRDPSFAVSFTRNADSNPVHTLVTINLSGTAAAAPADVTLESATCFDRTGQPVAAPDVRIE